MALKANGEGKGQGSANFGSVDHGTKSPKRNPRDSPSASATNAHGCEVVDTRLRSVLCHPFGLPLMCVFNGNDPSTLKCLKKGSPDCAFERGPKQVG